MSVGVRLAAAWRTITRGPRLDRELDDELQAFVGEMIDRRVARGERQAEARRAVLLEIGGMEAVKEQVREARMGHVVEETWRDVTYAWRGLKRAPAFTAAALTVLALAVGGTAAIFSVAHALLVRPLPFREPDRLVFVWADQTAEGYPRAPLSGPELRDLNERAVHFEGFGGIWATTAALTDGDQPEQLRVGLVTSDFFPILGAEPAIGRTFRREDESAGAPTSILLSAAVWQSRYAGDPSVVGTRVDVNGSPTLVVGVMPSGFRLMMPPDAAVPDGLQAWLLLPRDYAEGPRGQRYLRVIGRMRRGVAAQDALADVARVGREISAAHTYYGAAGRRFETVPLHLDAVKDVRRPLLILAAGVAILLVIACMNVGGLLLARAAARQRETALKQALGAGTGRVVRQHVVEALLLGSAGAALGVLLAQWVLALLLASTPDALSRLRIASLHLPAMSAAVLTVLIWMALLALVQASHGARRGMPTALRDDRRHTGTHARSTLRTALTVSQLALSVALVAAALLLARSVHHVQHMDVGFEPAGILSFRLALPDARYGDHATFNAFSRRLQDSLGNLPGASAAAAISHAPYDHVPNWGGPYLAREGADPSTAPQADYRAVSPGALQLLNVTLIEGRWFTEDDDTRRTPVVIVDERLARRTWPSGPAIGRRLVVDPAVTGTPSTAATVVGVVRHMRHRSPIAEVRDQVYFSARQAVRNPSVYLVKTAGRPEALVPHVRAALRELDPLLPIYDVRPLTTYAADARALREFTAFLAAMFAFAALVLAAVGVYGVIAYGVTQRRQEFGVRLTLGAAAWQIVGLVLRDGAVMAAAGLLLGFGVAAAGVVWLESQLAGIPPWDPLALTGTVVLLACTALLACAVPARRASRTDPAAVLREG